MGDSIIYAAPAPVVAGPLVLRVDGDRGSALRVIATHLRRAGFVIESQDGATGEIRAKSRHPYLVNCGLLTQSARGEVATIRGTAPLAAIFDADAPEGVLRREVRVRTEVTVRLEAGETQRALLDEKQTVSLLKLSADGGTVLSSQTLAAVKGEVMTFADGTQCMSSGKLVEAFR